MSTVVASIDTDTPNLSRVLSKLPASAVAKFRALQSARDDARVLYEAAMDKLAELRQPYNDLSVAQKHLAEIEATSAGQVAHNKAAGEGALSEEQHTAALDKFRRDHEAAQERVAALQAEHDAAKVLADARAKHWQALNTLVGRIEDWLADLGDGRRVPSAAEPIMPKLAKGQLAADEVANLREVIAALRAEHKRVDRAAPPAADTKRRIPEFVAQKAARVRVGGLVGRDIPINVQTPELDAAFALACWLNPDAVIRRLEKETDEQLESRFTLSDLDRARDLKKLSDRLLETERREEALIELAAQQGTRLARRPDVDPRAILGLE